MNADLLGLSRLLSLVIWRFADLRGLSALGAA
jgi:hypothetical protein